MTKSRGLKAPKALVNEQTGRLNREPKNYNSRPGNKGSMLLKTDPEFKRRFLEAGARARAERRGCRQTGIPDGWRAKDWQKLRKQKEPEIHQITETLMAEYVDLDNITDESAAKIALKAAVEIIVMPNNISEKNKAIKTVLDFTKQKPASKAEVTLNTAEDFLNAIIEKEKNDA